MAGGDDPAAQTPAPPPTDSSAGPSPAEPGPRCQRLASFGHVLTALRRRPASDLIDLVLRRPGRLYTLFLLLIVALKWPFATIPPVWDEAFSIFPAADFLIRNGFNYPLLLSQPGYHDGGPTAHALSLLTLVTALVLKLTGGGTPAWIVLHFLQWLMGAAIGTMLTRLYSRLFGDLNAFLLAVCSLVYPLMLAQLGTMYIEVPLLFFSLLAFYQYTRQRLWLASLCLLAACLTKGSGVIAVGTVAALALCLGPKPVARRILEVFVLAVPSALTLLSTLQAPTSKLSLSGAHGLGTTVMAIASRDVDAYGLYVAYAPDIGFMLLGSILASVYIVYRGLRTEGPYAEFLVVPYNALLILLFVFFHFAVYAHIQKTDTHFITRYLFYVVPSILLVLYYVVHSVPGRSGAKSLILLVFIAVCLTNRSGMLYPRIPYSSIAIAERSEEYVGAYFVQRECISLIETRVHGDIPVYVSLPDFFLTHYPVLGYVHEPLGNVHYIRDALGESNGTWRCPDHFALALNYPGLGGATIRQIIKSVYSGSAFSCEVLGFFKRGDFAAHLVEVRRIGPTVTKPKE